MPLTRQMKPNYQRLDHRTNKLSRRVCLRATIRKKKEAKMYGLLNDRSLKVFLVVKQMGKRSLTEASKKEMGWIGTGPRLGHKQ